MDNLIFKGLIGAACAAMAFLGARDAAAAGYVWQTTAGCATTLSGSNTYLVATGCETTENRSLSWSTNGFSWIAFPDTGAQLSIGPNNEIFMRKASGLLYRWNGTSWVGPIQINGVNACVSYINGFTGGVMALDCSAGTNKGVWSYSTSTNSWTAFPGKTGSQVSWGYSAGMYLLNGTTIWKWETANTWSQNSTTTTHLGRGGHHLLIRGFGGAYENALREWKNNAWSTIVPGGGGAVIHNFAYAIGNYWALMGPFAGTNIHRRAQVP